MLIGGVVGAVAGSGASGFEAGKAVGEKASIEFFQNFCLIVFVGQIVLFSVLAFMEKLPGTTKFKRKIENS